MKIRATERILLVVFALIMIFFSLLIIALSWNVILPEDVEGLFVSINSSFLLGLISTVLSLLLIILSVKIMFVNTKRPAVNAAVVKVAEFGSVRVSIDTVNTLAVKFAKSVENVRDVRINTMLLPDGIDIYIRAALISDAKIPEVSQNIQNTVKTSIEEHTGLSVKNVPVFIDNSVDISK